MGKIGQGILGGISGKVGNVVGASWKGIHYIRIKPASVANPRTEGQVNQRSKFAATVAFLKANQAFVKRGFRFQQNRQTASNAAMAYNIRNAVTGVAPDFEIDPTAALLSEGSLTGSAGGSASVLGEEVQFSWENNSNSGNARPDDRALLLVYNADKKESVSVLEEELRRDGLSGSVGIPANYAGDTLHFYLAFESADKRAVSNSNYLGSQTV